MSKPSKPRCKRCLHRPGRRIVSLTSQTKGGDKMAEPRQHKKPCDCICHGGAQ